MQRYCMQDKKSPNFQDIRSPTHETPSLLPRHVNKDATSINNFTNKNLANRRQQVLFWVLFHTTILLYLHFCSWEHCHPLLYSLNSYFFNLFLILICALTFFCYELFFFCRNGRTDLAKLFLLAPSWSRGGFRPRHITIYNQLMQLLIISYNTYLQDETDE